MDLPYFWKTNIEKFNISLNSQPKHFPTNTPFGGAEYFRSLKNQITRLFYFSPQSRRNFGERLISIFLTKIIAAIFSFNGSGRLGRKKICTNRAVDGQKQGERWGWGSKVLLSLPRPLPLPSTLTTNQTWPVG